MYLWVGTIWTTTFPNAQSKWPQRQCIIIRDADQIPRNTSSRPSWTESSNLVVQGLMEGRSRSSRHFLDYYLPSQRETMQPQATLKRNRVSSLLPSEASIVEPFEPYSQAFKYSPRNFLTTGFCGNLKTSLLRVSHCMRVTLIELAFMDTVLASLRKTTCSLLML